MFNQTPFLARLFSTLDSFQSRLSDRWRAGANERTVIIIVLLGSLCTYAYLFFVQPPDTFPIDTLVTIPAGKTLEQTAAALQEQGVIRSARSFRIVVTLLGHQRDIHAGDYIFKEPRDVFSIARAVVVGQFGLEPIKIRVPEGATTAEMARIFSVRLQRFNDKSFLAQAQPQEGYLFPDTYFFLPNATEDVVIRTMRQDFDDHIAKIMPLVASSSRSLSDIVIMASILEREGNGLSDRRMIAGVLWNRIDKKMALQVDAAFLYTLGKSTFQLTKKDLRSDSPYNTYTHKGLPPTAIGSPSFDSLLAAATPTKNDYLFYLADQDGVTHYSKTYGEHSQKKSTYIDSVR